MPNLLLVAQAVAPIGGSHSTRVTHLVKELARRGWDITVLATKIYPGTPEIDYSLLAKIPKTVKFLRGFPGPLHYHAYRKPSAGGNIPGKSSKLKKMFLVPDTYIEWLPGAVWELIKQGGLVKKPDLILSSAVPYTSHLTGLLLHWLFRKPWVIDYGDPWVYDPGHPRKGLRFLLERFLEGLVIRNSDTVLVTTPSTRLLYLDKYRMNPERIKVLPMAYDPEDFQKSQQEISPKQNSTLTRFVYAGRLEPESRNTQPFLKALAKLNSSGNLVNYQFEFAGSFKSDFNELLSGLNLERLITFHPWLEHSRCMDLLVNADYLLLFGNNNSVQIPGKVFNYLGSGAPIVYLSDLSPTDDPVYQLLKQSGRKFWRLQNNTETIVEFFLKFSEVKNNAGRERSNLPNFTWAERGETLDNIFHSILGEPR